MLPNPLSLKKISLLKPVLLGFPIVMAAAFAQAEVNYIPSSTLDHSWSSGSFNGYGDESVATTHVIKHEGALWLRVYFDDVHLGDESYITITSSSDGSVQRLTAATLQQSNNTSAIFNGDEVVVKLYAKYPDRSVRLGIKQVEAGETPRTAASNCGADNRYYFDDAAVGRVDNGCTAWIIRNGKLVTAGHCAGGMKSVEFNVPRSNSNGSLNHSTPDHQYTIDQGSVKYRNDGPGGDWAVFNVYNNSQTGQSPIQRQGKSFNVTQNNPGGTIRVTGFGQASGSANQSSRTHTGPLTSTTNTRVMYSVDTSGGNSGSPIIDEATGVAVGVHTHGGCTSTGGSNSGTRSTLGEFWNAMGLSTTPSGPVSFYQHCSYGGYSAGLGVGRYTLSQLRGLGIANDDISSLKVQSGYRVTMYQHDNFTGNTIVKTGNDSCLVDDGFNDDISSVVIEAAGGGWSTTIQAENFANMSGIDVEACSEGGQNIGWLDVGDWVVWDANLPSSGSYRVEYRVAGTGGVIQLERAGGGTIYGQKSVPNTGGWQNWQTISHDVNLDAGQQQIAIYVPTAGYNINWIKITKR